jgi:hypothetical protein
MIESRKLELKPSPNQRQICLIFAEDVQYNIPKDAHFGEGEKYEFTEKFTH